MTDHEETPVGTPDDQQDAPQGEQMQQALAAIQQARANAQVFERFVVPNPEVRFGKLADMAPDLHYAVPDGAPEPEALSYRAGTRTFIFPVSAAVKQRLLQEMSAGVIQPTAAEIAKLAG